jgi:hypothetical protein
MGINSRPKTINNMVKSILVDARAICFTLWPLKPTVWAADDVASVQKPLCE